MNALRYDTQCSLKGRYLLVLAFFALFSDIASAGFEPETQFHHVPVFSIRPGEPIYLEADITDPLGIRQVRCYFQYEESAPYLFVEMRPTTHGYACWLPAPATHVYRIYYLLMAVNADRQVVRTSPFRVTIQGEPGDRNNIDPFVSITVKSDIRIPDSVFTGFAPVNPPIHHVVDEKENYGLQVALYDMSQNPEYRYGFFGGFEVDIHKNTMIPIRGYMGFPVSPDMEGEMTLSGEATAEGYPDINGANWSGSFYVASSSGLLLSNKIPITALVVQDGWGNVKIAVTSNRACPGRNLFSGTINTSGYMMVYDLFCDDEDWTTHWHTATSTSIQIMDYIDPPYYQTLNVVDLTRPGPIPMPVAPR